MSTSQVGQAIQFGGASLNLGVRILYIPAAIWAWLMLMAQSWRSLLAFTLFGIGFFIVGQYGGVIISTTINTMNQEIAPIYWNSVRPVLSGIIREFFNRIICWLDGFLMFPYLVGRNVIFVILRDGGFGTAVLSFAQFLNQFGQDFFINYFANGRFLSQEFDYSPMFLKWRVFFTDWQQLWCYGCQDVCPYYTDLPIFIAIFTSDQYKDFAWGDFLGKSFNGWMVIIQQIIYQLREIIYPTGSGLITMNFDRAFQLFCEAQRGLRISFENILQETWDAFVPYRFVWTNVLCFFDGVSCIILRSVNFIINMVLNAGAVISHFAGIDSTYWNGPLRLQFEAIINLYGPADYFEPIELEQTTITTYQLLTNVQHTPNGQLNPIYGEHTLGDCFCIALTRIICDPQNNGTTCQQQYNNSLLSQIDPCCWTTQGGTLIANSLAPIYEFSLHLFSVSDFIEYINNQPFSQQVAASVINTVNCFWSIFQVVQIYGFCIRQILSELTVFVGSTLELWFRLIIAIFTVPYYNTFLPGQCNLVSCVNTTAFDESIAYLDRISNPLLPNGLVNCMCFVLNTGFNVKFAGCSDVPCTPTGFIPPQPNLTRSYRLPYWKNRKRREKMADPVVNYYYSHSLYDIMRPNGRYKDRISKTVKPQFIGGNWKRLKNTNFRPTFEALDKRFETFGKQLGTCGREDGKPCGKSASSFGGSTFSDRLIPLPIVNVDINCTNTTHPTPDPVPCFGLCCLPVKTIQLAAHIVEFSARAVEAGFQSRFGNGSQYWNGQDCEIGLPCFASDLTVLVIRLAAPVECICDFLKLVIPPQGFGDFCCAIDVFAELISCSFQILINVANSVAGDPNFTYIQGTENTTAPLITDFDVVLDIGLELFDCICSFFKTIFNIAFGGNEIYRAFNICCIPRVYVRTILEVFRLLMHLLISLSTLDSPQSQKYLYINDIYNARPYCPQSVSELGIVIQFRQIVSVIFMPPTFDVTTQCTQGSNSSLGNITSEQAQNQQGLTNCLCNTANALLSMVYMITDNFVGNLTQAPKCTVNLCCPIYNGGSVIFYTLNTLAEATATLWQNWRHVQILGTSTFVFVPQETMNYFFCDEYGPGPYYSYVNSSGGTTVINNPGIYPGYPNSLVNNRPIGAIPNPNASSLPGIVNPNAILASKCGKLEPALQAIQNLLGGCLCLQTNNGVMNILDNLLSWLIAFSSSNSQIFPFPVSWPGCLCKGGPIYVTDKGIVAPAAKAIVILLRQVIILVRNIGNPSMWAPAGGTLMDPNYSLGVLTDNYADIRLTWFNRWLAPLADQLCILFRNAGCLLNMVLGNACTSERFTLLGSIARYFMEAIIRIGSLIEGSIKMFTQEPPGLCVGSTSNVNGNEDRPGDQGTFGQYGQLVPTCSPTGNFILGSPTNSLDAGQLGRILNSILGFVADAFGGIARYGCSTVCPGFNTTQSYLAAQKPFRPGSFSAQDKLCNCWQISPYSGLFLPGGQLCTFEVCNPYFNGNGTMNFTCPGGKSYCNAVDALNPPNTGGAQNWTYQTELGVAQDIEIPCGAFLPDETFVCGTSCYMNGPNLVQRCISYTGGTCNAGCSNDASRFQDQVSGRQYVPGSATTWEASYKQYPFSPVVDLTQPSGWRCEITNPLFQNDTYAMQALDMAFGKTIYQTIPFVPFAFCQTGVFGGCPTGYPELDIPKIDQLYPNWRALGEHTMCDTSYAFISGNGPYNHAIATDSNYSPFFGSCFLESLCSNEAEFTQWDPWFGSCIANNPALNVPILPPTFGNLPRWALTVTPVPMRSLCMACRIAFRYNVTYGNDRLPASVQPACTKETCIITKQLCKNDQMIPCCLSDPSPLDGILVAGVKYFSCLMYATFGGFPAQIFDALGGIISLLWQISGGLNRLVSWFTVFVLATIFELAQGIALGGAAAVAAVASFFFSFIPAIIGILAHFSGIFGQHVILGFKRTNETGNFTLRVPSPSMPIIDDAHDCIDNLCVCRVFDFDCSGNNLTTVHLLNKIKDRFGGETSCDMLFLHLIELNPINWTDLSYSNRYLATDCIVRRIKGEFLEKITRKTIPADYFYDPLSLFKLLGNMWSQKRTEETPPPREPRISTRFKEKFHMTQDHYARYLNSRGVRLREFYQKVHGMSDDSLALMPLMHLELFHHKWETGYYHYLYDDMSWSNFQKNIGTSSENWRHVMREYNDLSKSMKYIYEKLDRHYGYHVREKIPPMPSFLRVVLDGSLWNSMKVGLSRFNPISVQFNPPSLDLSYFSIQQTPHDRPALNAGKRILYSAAHVIWPHYTTKEIHDKFITGGNCRIIDGVINEGSSIVRYCLDEFVANTNTTKAILGDYVEKTRHLGPGFHRDFHGRWEYQTIGKNQSEGWKRPRVISAGTKRSTDYIPLELRTYHRATRSTDSTATDWINTLSSWLGIDIIQTISNWVADFIAWMENPHISDIYYPDVGARYWAQHMIICKWPTSLNCALGIGLRDAIVSVGRVYGIAFLILVLIFPGALLSPLSIFFNILIFFLFVTIVAWNYSPACMILFPTSNLGSTVWTVPVLPIPLNIFPALPMCMWDEIISLLDDIFAYCYTWIPQTILNNQQCVGPVSLPNCDDVGLNSPTGAIAYWGYKIFGSWFCDVMNGITSLFPFLGSTSSVCFAIKHASPTQVDRLLYCAILSSGSLVLVGVGFYVVGTFIIAIVAALINALHAVILLVPTLPFYDGVVGMGSAQGVFEIPNEGEMVTAEEAGATADAPSGPIKARIKFQPIGISDRISRFFQRAFVPNLKMEKIE